MEDYVPLEQQVSETPTVSHVTTGVGLLQNYNPQQAQVVMQPPAYSMANQWMHLGYSQVPHHQPMLQMPQAPLSYLQTAQVGQPQNFHLLTSVEATSDLNPLQQQQRQQEQERQEQQQQQQQQQLQLYLQQQQLQLQQQQQLLTQASTNQLPPSQLVNQLQYPLAPCQVLALQVPSTMDDFMIFGEGTSDDALTNLDLMDSMDSVLRQLGGECEGEQTGDLTYDEQNNCSNNPGNTMTTAVPTNPARPLAGSSGTMVTASTNQFALLAATAGPPLVGQAACFNHLGVAMFTPNYVAGQPKILNFPADASASTTSVATSSTTAASPACNPTSSSTAASPACNPTSSSTSASPACNPTSSTTAASPACNPTSSSTAASPACNPTSSTPETNGDAPEKAKSKRAKPKKTPKAKRQSGTKSKKPANQLSSLETEAKKNKTSNSNEPGDLPDAKQFGIQLSFQTTVLKDINNKKDCREDDDGSIREINSRDGCLVFHKKPWRFHDSGIEVTAIEFPELDAEKIKSMTKNQAGSTQELLDALSKGLHIFCDDDGRVFAQRFCRSHVFCYTTIPGESGFQPVCKQNNTALDSKHRRFVNRLPQGVKQIVFDVKKFEKSLMTCSAHYEMERIPCPAIFFTIGQEWEPGKPLSNCLVSIKVIPRNARYLRKYLNQGKDESFECESVALALSSMSLASNQGKPSLGPTDQSVPK